MEICYSQTAHLTASSTDDKVSFTWYSDNSYTDIIGQESPFETSTLTVDTVFYVEAIPENGCISKDSVKITVNPVPDLKVKNRETICKETSVLLEATSTEGVSIAWYRDSACSDLIDYGVSYQTKAQSVDTVFWLTSTSDKGCITRDSIKIEIIQPPIVVAMDDYHLCKGEEITLTTLQTDGDVTWNVDPITVSPTSTEEYIVTASRYPCPAAKDTVIITVGDSLYILPSVLPEYQFNIEYQQQLTTNAEYPRFSISEGNLPYGLILSPYGILSGTNTQRENNQEQQITVKVEDMHKCRAFKEYTFTTDLFIPQVFSPDGDGINDIFMNGFKVIIIDRLGIEIFRGDNGWDGTHKGKTVASDIYFYTLHYKTTNGESHIKRGYIGVIK
jgi:gliding motility-associated-like protein